MTGKIAAGAPGPAGGGLLHRASIFSLLCFAFFLIIPSAAPAAYRPHIGRIIVSRNRSAVIFFTRAENSFNDELLSSLKNGLPLSFEYEVQVLRERRLWPDRITARLRLIHRLEYDMVKEMFIFTAAHGNEEIRKTTQSAAEAQRWMNTIDGAEAVSVSLLKGGKRYFLRIRMEIVSGEEFFSRNIFFFSKSSRLTTGWRYSPLFVVGEGS